MYAELFEIWRRENESPTLLKLPDVFYSRALEYVLEIESKIAGATGDPAIGLFKKEAANSKILILELIQTRARKVARLEPNEPEVSDEEKILFRKVALNPASIFEQAPPQTEAEKPPEPIEKTPEPAAPTPPQPSTLPQVETAFPSKEEFIMVRVIKETPALMGTDLQVHGPFKPEDVAMLPLENAEALIKQGLALKI